MRRTISAFFILSLLSTVALGHGDNSHFPNKQDVTVKTTKMNGNVYMLQAAAATSALLWGRKGS